MPRDRSDDSSSLIEPRAPLGDRLRAALLKPPSPDRLPSDVEPLTEDELRAAVRSANDKERIVGAFAAPLAAAIAIVVVGSLLHNDPPHYLTDGALNPKYTNPHVYEEVLGVLIALSVLILGFAIWRKRLLLGITMGLYGISVFNLKFWGFGIPFAIAAGWLIVRHYRFTRDLKALTGDGPSAAGGSPRPNKRYTPPTRK